MSLLIFAGCQQHFGEPSEGSLLVPDVVQIPSVSALAASHMGTCMVWTK